MILRRFTFGPLSEAGASAAAESLRLEVSAAGASMSSHCTRLELPPFGGVSESTSMAVSSGFDASGGVFLGCFLPPQSSARLACWGGAGLTDLGISKNLPESERLG